MWRLRVGHVARRVRRGVAGVVDLVGTPSCANDPLGHGATAVEGKAARPAPLFHGSKKRAGAGEGCRRRIEGARDVSVVLKRVEMCAWVGVDFRKTDRRDFRGRQPRPEPFFGCLRGNSYFWVTRNVKKKRKKSNRSYQGNEQGKKNTVELECSGWSLFAFVLSGDFVLVRLDGRCQQ